MQVCGVSMCVSVCVFMFSQPGPPRKPIIAAVVVRWCFRLKAVRGGLVNSTCDRDDSIICQLPTGTQRAASLLLRRVSVHFWLKCLRNDQSCALTKKRQSCFACFLSWIKYCSAYIIAYLYQPFAWVFCFHFCFIAFSFYVSYKRVLSVNSNYPPFLSLNQSFGYHTCFSSPSKQLWLWCWPRFTVLLKQYVVLCLGFLGMVYECTHSSVIVYSPKSACQFVINVKRQTVWVY